MRSNMAPLKEENSWISLEPGKTTRLSPRLWQRCDVCPPQQVVESGQPLTGMHITQQRLGMFINAPPPRVHQDPTPMHRGKPTMVLCTNHTTHSGYREVSWVIAMYCSTPTPHAHQLALATHWYAAWFQ
jgi:hypothetical protein